MRPLNKNTTFPLPPDAEESYNVLKNDIKTASLATVDTDEHFVVEVEDFDIVAGDSILFTEVVLEKGCKVTRHIAALVTKVKGNPESLKKMQVFKPSPSVLQKNSSLIKLKKLLVKLMKYQRDDIYNNNTRNIINYARVL